MRQRLFRLDAELFQAFLDCLPLPFHNIAEADHLYGSHAPEGRQATSHGLVEEDRGLMPLPLVIGPSHLLLKFADALCEEVLMAHLIVPLLNLRHGLEADEKVPGLRNGGPHLRSCLFIAIDQDAHLDAAERSQLARLLY
jgi:hypothetical protein